MITPKTRDMNRSRDVEGPKLKRAYDQEKNMKEKMGSDVFHDSAPTGTLEKCPLSDLHYGDHEVPLTATGLQQVVVSAPMGHDHPDHKPTTSKGPTKDQSHHGGKDSKSGSYSEKSKSE